MRLAALLRLTMPLSMMIWPGVALAADPPAPSAATPPPGLVALLQRPEHRHDLLAAAQAVDAALPQPCTSASYSTTGEVGMLEPLRLDSAGKPVAGAWKEAITETGCGGSRQLNALTKVQPDGKTATHPLLPGSTITDPQLQEDSVQYAAAGMGAMPPGCTQGGIVNTEFVGVDGQPPGVKPQPGGTLKPWTERWTLQACAKRAMVTMKFTPDDTGTAIQATPAAP